MGTSQKFDSVHASVFNHFNQERNPPSREIFKLSRTVALAFERNAREVS